MATRRQQRGFTLLEMLISTALLAMLLTAIALAMHASLTAYRENDAAAALNQTTRLLLVRMGREVRTALAVDHEAPANQLIIYPPANDKGIQRVEYLYDGVARTLSYLQTIDGATTTQVLLSNTTPVKMTYFNVRYDVVQDDQGVLCTRRAVATMRFDSGGQTSTMVCSASPRRNLDY